MNNPLLPPKNKIKSEADFRRAIINQAKSLGCDIEVRNIFAKYDRLLANCTNPEERKEIAQLGIVELHRFLDCYGGLVINGQEVLPPEE